MMVIDIGSAATDRGGAGGNNYTLLSLLNPANDSGVLTAIEIWAVTDITGCKAGTFYGSGASWQCRSYATIGNVTSGSKQTFNGLNIAVQINDLLGVFFDTGSLEIDTTGGQAYYLSGDKFSGGPYTFTDWGNKTLSLYGIGATIQYTSPLPCFRRPT